MSSPQLAPTNPLRPPDTHPNSNDASGLGARNGGVNPSPWGNNPRVPPSDEVAKLPPEQEIPPLNDQSTKLIVKTAGKRNCMCCDSSLRLPKDLSVFRCMICLTINDVKPPRASGGQPVVPCISIERTKSIIDQCITDFLSRRRYIKLMNTDALPNPQPHHGAHNLHTIEVEATSTKDGSMHHSHIISSPRSEALNNNTSSSSGGMLTRQILLSGLLHEEKQPFQDALSFPATDGERDGPYMEYPAGHQIPSSSITGNAPSNYKEGDNSLQRPPSTDMHPQTIERSSREQELVETMFKPLEKYITDCFTSLECLNGSFLPEPLGGTNDVPTAHKVKKKASLTGRKSMAQGSYDKPLLIGQGRTKEREKQHEKDNHRGKVNMKRAGIDWDALHQWYDLIVNAGANVVEMSRSGATVKGTENNSDDLKEKEKALDILSHSEEEEWELFEAVEEARHQVLKVLLEVTEKILKRPGRPLKEPGDIRFLPILLYNPLLYPSYSRPTPPRKLSRKQEKSISPGKKDMGQLDAWGANLPGRNTGIIKRLFGLISMLPNICHHYLVSCLSQLSEVQFRKIVELGGSLITFRLSRQHTRDKNTGGSITESRRERGFEFKEDWQIRAAAKFMALLISANSNGRPSKDFSFATYSQSERDGGFISPAEVARRQAHARGQIISISDFYISFLDYSNLVGDFEIWENRSPKFSFCQYPFLLSMGAKIHILESDAKRQMEVKAREAFFSSLSNSRRTYNGYLTLKVRRRCLAEDSLKGISESVGAVGDIKKGLRIEFVGEDGVDAGGLRKEWFLLLVREVFDPSHGLFVYDEESQYCYFNPDSFESSEEFFLIGVVFGLAIYNSTILDVALPPCVFKKLLQPTYPSNKHFAHSNRPSQKHTLEDLAVFRPTLARGLHQLLEFEGDVEEVFCRNFVVEVDRFGVRSTVPLVYGGENLPVTNENRKDFVGKYITYLLDTSVAKQFEPFKRGFYTVSGGNALSLFRPEELELLIRGSEEPLDISALRAVAVYEGWGGTWVDGNATAENDPVVKWFWSFFERITPKEQRLLLSFITGSDRIPGTGATNLVIKVLCAGEDCDRFPVARTCFNAVCLYRYKRREKLERMLWRAVQESEGFGLR